MDLRMCSLLLLARLDCVETRDVRVIVVLQVLHDFLHPLDVEYLRRPEG